MLTFNNHIASMCKKAARQLAVLKRIGRVAQSEIRKILRFRVVAEKVHSAQPKRFTRPARNTASLKSGGGGGGWRGGVVAELSTKKSVDLSQNAVFP